MSRGCQGEGQVRPQANPCKMRFVVDKVAIEQVYFRMFRSSPVCIIQPMLDTSVSLIHRPHDVILATDSVDEKISSLF